MSRTFRRVNKYVPYCTLFQVKDCNSRLQIALMDPHHYRFCMKYMAYDEEHAASYYRDGMKIQNGMSNRKNSIYKAKEKAYYKSALTKCLKSDDREYEEINIRKILAGYADWW